MGRKPVLAVGLLALACLASGLAVVAVRAPAGSTRAAAVAAPADALVAPAPPVAAPALPLTGCPPPPPRRASGPGAQPWHPAVLVPDAALPVPAPPAAWAGDLSVLQGKGMWIWKMGQTEGGDPAAIVARAKDAGLRQLWVRVGDSQSGFYAASALSALVPAAHREGVAVIGWGFPYLWDPGADARWSADALAWRGPDGSALDGFSPDIEMASEGVQLSEARAQVYLGQVRAAAGRRLVVATVYRPSDIVWGRYPYAAIAPYVDAFAPMVYWGCTEPGDAAIQSMQRLASMRPVHLIGQAYDMYDDGEGRDGAPGPGETQRFLDVARRQGALGASFWVWQSIQPDQWTAMADFRWPASPPAKGRS